MVKIYENYEEYKQEVAQWVDQTVLGAKLYMDKIQAVKVIKNIAEQEAYSAPFLFQDEDARHFNADIAKYCRELLDTCNTSC